MYKTDMLVNRLIGIQMMKYYDINKKTATPTETRETTSLAGDMTVIKEASTQTDIEIEPYPKGSIAYKGFAFAS
jgi:hypothetical protein